MALNNDAFDQLNNDVLKEVEKSIYESIKRQALSKINPVCLNCPHRTTKTNIYDSEDLESFYTKYDFVVKFSCAKAGKKIIVKKANPDFATYNTPVNFDEKPYMVPESISVDTMEIPYCPDYLLDESKYTSLSTGYKSGLPNDGGLLRLMNFCEVTLSRSMGIGVSTIQGVKPKLMKSHMAAELNSMLRAYGAFSVLLNTSSLTDGKAKYTRYDELIPEFKIDWGLVAAATELVFMDLMGDHDSGGFVVKYGNLVVPEPQASISMFFELRSICVSLANLHNMSEHKFDTFIYQMPLEFKSLNFISTLYGLLGLMCKLNHSLPPNWALEKIQRTSDAYEIRNTNNPEKIIHLYKDKIPLIVRGVTDNLQTIKQQFLFYRQKLEVDVEDTDAAMASVFS